MTKQMRTRFDDYVNYTAFEEAHRRASRGKRYKSDVLKFCANETENLFHIMDVVGDLRYKPSDYHEFYIKDPKKRLILALPYWDRIVHQWYVENFIKPYYIPRFIADTYACIPDRGIHSAVAKMQQYMRQMSHQTDGKYYILKMDISKFFYNIDLNVLYSILERDIHDKKVLSLTHTMIFEDGSHDGLPIGNYISQYFANIYLNELDQYCKRVLKIKYYVRYMDDFIILAPDKATARRWFETIDKFVNERLHLKLNPKSRYYPGGHSLDFIGYLIYEDHILLRKRSKRHLLETISDFKDGVIDKDKFCERCNAWAGHAMHGNAYNYAVKQLGPYLPLWNGRLTNPLTLVARRYRPAKVAPRQAKTESSPAKSSKTKEAPDVRHIDYQNGAS